MAGLGQKAKELGDRMRQNVKIGREKIREKGADVAEKAKQRLK